MSIDVIAVVLAAAFLHASWNALIKGRQTHDPMIGAMVVAAGAALVSVGVLMAVGLPHPASYPYVVASGIIHVGYFLLVGASYRLADFSAVYPLMRGSAPLFTHRGLRVVTAAIGEREIGGFLVPLPRTPRARHFQWSEWMPIRLSKREPWPADRTSYRFRAARHVPPSPPSGPGTSADGAEGPGGPEGGAITGT